MRMAGLPLAPGPSMHSQQLPPGLGFWVRVVGLTYTMHQSLKVKDNFVNLGLCASKF